MARRRYQRGTVFLRGKREKVWVGRWREDVLVAGSARPKRKECTQVLGTLKEFPTKRLALRALQEKIDVINSRTYRPSTLLTFHEFTERWKGSVLVNYKASSQATLTSSIVATLGPFFDDLYLKDISGEIVQCFVANFKGSPKTLKDTHIATLRSMWSTAKTWGYVQHNPFDGLVLPRNRAKEPSFFSIDQMRTIITAAKEPQRSFYWLAAETGMRIGELTALRVEDIDVISRIAKVRRSVWRGVVQTTKTGRSDRNYLLSIPLCRHLCLGVLAKRKLSDFIFASRTGAPWDQGGVRLRHYRLLKRLCIPQAGIHAFRHGNETVMAHLNAPPKLRQQRLGHADDHIMLRYEHVLTQDEVTLVNKIGELFAPAGAA